MESIKARIARGEGPVKAELESLFSEILDIATKAAAYEANPITPESGEETKAEIRILAKVLGLETDDDWKPLADAYQANKPAKRVN